MNHPPDKATVDADRLNTLVRAGMDPVKADRLSAVISDIEDGTPDQAELADKKGSVLQVLIEQGIDTYTAFTALFCAPSPHANRKEAHAS